MLIKEFREQIKRGLGSALLFLKTNPEKVRKYSSAILDACIQENSYDFQCEGSRGRYLWEAIQLSGDPANLQEHILDALTFSQGPHDIEQMFDIATYMVSNGNQRAASVVKQKFGFYEPWNRCIGEREYIKIAGIEGLRKIVQIIGEKILDEDYSEDDMSIQYAKEILGEEKVKAFFEDEKKKDIRIKAYMDSVNEYVNRIIPEKTMTLDEVRSIINGKPRHYYGMLGRWGETASDDEINALTDEFLKETSRQKIIAYISVFTRRAFPLQIDKLIKLTRERGKPGYRAVYVLSKIKDARLHELGVELLQEQPLRYEAISLFERNYKSEDSELFERLFIKKNRRRITHDIGLFLLDVYEANPTPDCLNMMIHLYREGYCSYCRERCIQIMIENHILPEWIAEEAAYDSNEDIRKVIREYRSSAMV